MRCPQIELHLELPPSGFNENARKAVAKQLPLLLSVADGEEIIIQSIFLEHVTAE